MAKRLEGILDIPAKGIKKHEVVASSKKTGKRALDIAKYIINNGVHAPTIYFPLIVPEALMIEPTEDASVEDMELLIKLIREAVEMPQEEIEKLPVNLSIGRADEVRAARIMKLHW